MIEEQYPSRFAVVLEERYLFDRFGERLLGKAAVCRVDGESCDVQVINSVDVEEHVANYPVVPSVDVERLVLLSHEQEIEALRLIEAEVISFLKIEAARLPAGYEPLVYPELGPLTLSFKNGTVQIHLSPSLAERLGYRPDDCVLMGISEGGQTFCLVYDPSGTPLLQATFEGKEELVADLMIDYWSVFDGETASLATDGRFVVPFYIRTGRVHIGKAALAAAIRAQASERREIDSAETELSEPDQTPKPNSFDTLAIIRHQVGLFATLMPVR